MVLLSGENCGASRKPFTCVSFLDAPPVGGDDVELLLIFFGGVGEKCELFAVVGPGDVAFGVECACESGGDADWCGIGFHIFDVNGGVAVWSAVFAGESFDPGDVRAVGRDFGFGEAVRGAESFDDGVDFGGGEVGFSSALRRFSTSDFVPVVCWWMEFALRRRAGGAEKSECWRDFAERAWASFGFEVG